MRGVVDLPGRTEIELASIMRGNPGRQPWTAVLAGGLVAFAMS